MFLSSMAKGELVNFMAWYLLKMVYWVSNRYEIYLSQVTRSSISKPCCFLFLALAIYERFAVKIHVYHDAAPGLAQVPVLWLESYCGLSNGRSDDLVALTTLYL